MQEFSALKADAAQSAVFIATFTEMNAALAEHKRAF